MDVRHCDFMPQFLQDQNQTYRIRPAGHAGEHAIARIEHFVFSNGPADLKRKFGEHGEKCRRADSNRRPKDYETFALTA